MSLLQISSVLLAAPAGAAVFFLLYNRVFLQFRHSRAKLVVSLLSLLGLLSVSTLAGYAWAGYRSLLPAIALLLILGVGEVWRFARRRRCRGAAPVADTHHRIHLRRPFTTLELAVRRYRIPLPDWPGGRFRIVQLSDLHMSGHLPADYYARVADEATAAGGDVVIVTGDLISDTRHLSLLVPFLRRLRARLGVYAVLGNHDWWSDPTAVQTALAAAGVVWVANSCRSLPAVNGACVRLGGCERPWSNGLSPWMAPPENPAEPLILLTHTPDNIFHIARRVSHSTLVFAGHYHGGQIRIPWLGSLLVPSIHGRLFDHGHFVLNGVHLFVNAGIGAAMPRLRIYCNPEIVIVDLQGKGSD